LRAEKIFGGGGGGVRKFRLARRRASIFSGGGGAIRFRLAAAAEFGVSGI